MVTPAVVTNAGPLIYLAILGRFELLQRFFDPICIPAAVYHEVVVQGAGQPGAAETLAAVRDGWLKQVWVQNRIAVDALLDELDLGEAEAIVAARELGVERVLLDDGIARAKAQAMGLSVSGTIGILLLARKNGVALDLKRELDVLIRENFRLSPRLYQALTATS